MVVCDDPAFVFLHVPRTGGIAFCFAVKKALPHAKVLWRNGAETHMPWWEARQRWPSRPMYCVMRSPWEIFASCYRLHQWFATLDPMPPQLVVAEKLFRRLGRMRWQDWVQEMVRTEHLCPRGGFSVRYAGTEVTVLQYHEDPYGELSRLLGVKFDLQRMNSHGTHPKWSYNLVELVRLHCWVDVQRFGYESPKAEA